MWSRIINNLKLKFDSKLTKWQDKGFHAANRLHKLSINVCLIFITYQIYQFLKDYNDFFLRARRVSQLQDDYKDNEPINKKINDDE